MRMWMVNPRIMCRQHLLGEHVEHHMFVGTIQRGIGLSGYLENNLLEMESLATRHDELVVEIEARGYRHRSPLPAVSPPFHGKIDREASLAELIRRCPICAARKEALDSGREP